jgi:hypothetical protein
MGFKRTPGYGHQGLSVVEGSSPHNFEKLLRDTNRVEGVSGTTSGGFFEDNSDLLGATLQSVSTTIPFLSGTIYHVFAGIQTYLVIADDNKGKIICSDLNGPLHVQSPNTGTLYTIGSRVIILRYGDSDYGVIIGSPTEPVLNYRCNYSGLLSGIGTFHYHNRKYIRALIDNKDTARGLPDHSQNRPLDICEGDYSITNMLGGGFHTDAFQTVLRQAHDCGVWAFEMDRLLRFVGKSIQEFSLTHERYRGIDEHEVYGFEGISLYLWEALGFYKKPETLYKKYEGTSCLLGHGVGFMEPEKSDAVPFYRVRRYDGFLGQGSLQEIVVPPKELEEIHTQSSDQTPICVSRQQSLSDGTILLESTQAFHLIKHSNIRTFKRINEIDNPKGDDLKNSGEISIQPTSNRPAHTSNITDQILWAVRKQPIAPFEEHAKDFAPIPREQYPFEKDVQPGNLNALQSRDSIEEPPTVDLNIDERNGSVAVSGSRASISMLPDGGIVLRGACGEEILLQGGNITLSAPGDIRMMVGRSVVSLAGDDIVLRAKNSIDATATDNDVRIKAERNLDMVGGMSGNGRTLIENQARGYPTNKDVKDYEGENISGRGIVLKADQSMVGVFGKRIYNRTVEGGEIVLDSDAGKGSVKVRANYFGAEVQGSIHLCGGAGQLDKEVSDTAGSSGSTLLAISSQSVAISTANTSTMFRVFGRIAAKEAVTTDDYFIALNSERVGKFRDGQGSFSDETMQYDQERRQSFHDSNSKHFAEEFYEEDKIGTDEAIKNYTFSYRTTDQCGAGRFGFREPYWMELYGSEACSTLVTWSEPVYKYQDTIDQLPWPGYKAWEEDKSVTTNRTQYYNAEKGIDIEEGGAGESQEVTPAEFFRVMDPR